MILIPLILSFVYFGGWPLFALGLFIVFVGTHEFCSIVERAGYRPLRAFTMLLAALFVLDAQMAVQGIALPGGAEVSRIALSLAVMLSLIWEMARGTDARRALPAWAFLFAGAIYVGWLLRYYLLLRGLEPGVPGPALTVAGNQLVIERGALWLLVVMAATWLCDTTAYFVGSAFGRHRFAPRISPRKTWEGTLAGVGAAALTALVAVPLLGTPTVLALGLGLTIGMAAVLGDLAESLIKRGADVKDASSLIPGHGGLLDRLDSMLFTGVSAYYYLVLTQAVQI